MSRVGGASTLGSITGVNFELTEGIATIELDDAETRNALHDGITSAIRTMLAEWVRSSGLRGLVLTGAHGVFSSGGSLSMLEARRAEARTSAGRAKVIAEMRENARLVAELRAFPAPTIAAVDGACVGAALAWACACDLRVASEGAQFITGYARVGLGTDFGAAGLLAQLVGRGRAADWLFTSPVVSASQALAAGLVSSVHPSTQLRDAARQLIERLNPVAAVAMRGNLADSHLPFDEALQREAERFVATLAQ